MSNIIEQAPELNQENKKKRTSNYVELLKKFNQKKKETKMQAEINQGNSLFSFLNATMFKLSM